MKISYGDHFLRHIKKVPEKQQAKLSKLVVLLSENPFHPLLHTKSLSGDFSGLFSFRITRD